MSPNLVAVKGATIELKTDGSWLFGSGQPAIPEDGPTKKFTLDRTSTDKMDVDGKAPILLPDLRYFINNQMKTSYYTAAQPYSGVLGTGSAVIEAAGGSSFYSDVDGERLILQNDFGGIFVTTVLIAATNGPPNFIPDILLAKTGTWRIVDSGQNKFESD